MDKRQRLTARDIVNDYSEAELFRIIRDYGEDRFAYVDIYGGYRRTKASLPVELLIMK